MPLHVWKSNCEDEGDVWEEEYNTNQVLSREEIDFQKIFKLNSVKNTTSNTYSANLMALS